MNVIERVQALDERLSQSASSEDTQLQTLLTQARDAIDEAKSTSGAPARVIATLARLADTLAALRGTLAHRNADRELTALAHEAEAELTREIGRRKTELSKFAEEMMARDVTHTYIREIRDRTSFGPPIIDEGRVEVYLKSRGTDGAGDDDVTGTCGIWICVGDHCLCSEWECTLTGPSGEFP